MWYIGIDAHKKRCEMTAKDADGRIVARCNFAHTRDGWREALRPAPRGSQVAVECVGWYQAIFDLLDEMGLDGVLAHARNVRLIATSKKKTDRRDSETLCDLLRTGFLPRAHVPAKASRELRELVRLRNELGRTVVQTKNRVHRLLERAWIAPPSVSDLFGKTGRQFLATATLTPTHRLALDTLLDQLDSTKRHQQRLDAEIARRVRHDPDVDLLLGIDGLSVLGAAALRAEIDDAQRFPNRGAIRSNFGIVPSVRDSADTQRRGHITKQGSGLVRKILVQGCLHFVRNNPRAARKHARIHKRNAGVAKVAAAADLLTVVYQVLKTRTPYHHADPRRQERKRTELLLLAAQG